ARRGSIAAILSECANHRKEISRPDETRRMVCAVTSALHEPIAIGGCTIRNRLYRAPVLEGAGSGPDGPSIYKAAFEENARAGVGLIIQGNSCLPEDGRSSPG